MDLEDLKQYSVIFGRGSGVLFQPMNNREYTYILTAKHNLYTDKECTVLHGTIPIEFTNPALQKIESFEIKLGENCFPHIKADIAFVLINYMEGFDKIIIDCNCKEFANVLLCGFPDDNRKNPEKITIREQFSNLEINREINSENYHTRVELKRQYDDQPRIVGYSGGGLLRTDDDYISIIGIQSEVTSTVLSNGQIEFVPIKYFNEIVDYNEYKNSLTPLLPPYMASFEFLKNEIFNLEEAIVPQFRSKIKNAYHSKMRLIEISPYDLYNSKYKKYPLLNNESDASLLKKEIWKAWLEYLLILSFISDNQITMEQLDSVLNEKRLIHSESNDSFIDIIPDLILKTDLLGIKNNSVLIVSTKSCPKTKRRVNAGMLSSIFEVRSQNTEMTIDNASTIKRIKEIIHIKAFQLDCILENETALNRYGVTEIEELIADLKNKFHEFLESKN
ncbi:ABC-three component system protein [Maribellus sediminis]|uniref:ABC-three component system protein n=1 Tax=Maribellus sediminis TaxID=2696285 RepID=UPI0014316B2D|nr:ABC-three component system protein [Maribellus sediminis]